MKTKFPLLLVAGLVALLAAFAAGAVAQSGRKVARPTTAQPLPPVQAPVFTPPDPEPEPAYAPRAKLHILPPSLLRHPLKALDNSTFRLGDFDGKVVVVNLWASWCGPCRREVPEYEKVRKEYAGRNVEFIGLTTEDPRTSSERVNKFVRSVNFGFRLGWADGETAKTLMNGSNAVPQTLVIAGNGRVISHWDGYARGQSGDHLRASIEQALEKSAEAKTGE
jgi:thiol-disulfide isomerase/thioredoxin